MIIAIAGPYSAPNKSLRKQNLRVLNEAAARIYELGHIPVVGVNAALPVMEMSLMSETRKGIMDISMALMPMCDACFFISESPGANKERAYFIERSLPVYYRLEDIPEAKAR